MRVLIAAALLLVGCKREDPQAATAQAAQALASASEECTKLDRAECMGSAECMLEHPGPPGPAYVCRAASGLCETGLRQGAKDFEGACRARPGCVHQPER